MRARDRRTTKRTNLGVYQSCLFRERDTDFIYRIVQSFIMQHLSTDVAPVAEVSGTREIETIPNFEEVGNSHIVW